MNSSSFANSLLKYSRLTTRQVSVGNVTIGGSAPIRVQSMTTTDTNDVDASIAQSLRIVEAGGELVRLTTQGVREAENIGLVGSGLKERGCNVPLVADVHFNPKAAETAASRVEAVRINPGNYTGEAKKFNAEADVMSDADWHALIVSKIRPLVDICKANHTVIRIGVNHGSLSDRIMAKYGDTPEGMVASCIEYLDAFSELDFFDIVISIKSSNTRVMVETVRLLSASMIERGQVYPLHLGVTEAGNDSEGRIKSAAGIGALLADGIGDTIRVSLTEAPEAEIPVAKLLVSHIDEISKAPSLEPFDASTYSPYCYARRKSLPVAGIGGNNQPVLFAPASVSDNSFVDFVIDGCSVSSSDGKTILNLCDLADAMNNVSSSPFLVRLSYSDLSSATINWLKSNHNVVVLMNPHSDNKLAEMRAISLSLSANNVTAPVIALYESSNNDLTSFQIMSAADTGLLFIDGLADGILLINNNIPASDVVNTADLILQATRARFSHTEFISCPGCGRTLYELQETVALIKNRMGHLKGLKIGVMGCIVNGIGEMADADYGYVGAGRGMISLYRGKELILRSVPQDVALDRLVDIIKADGKWFDKN